MKSEGRLRKVIKSYEKVLKVYENYKKVLPVMMYVRSPWSPATGWRAAGKVSLKNWMTGRSARSRTLASSAQLS